MYTCVKALLIGEDFASDPVTRSLRLGLRLFSGGQLDVNIQSFSQVSADPKDNHVAEISKQSCEKMALTEKDLAHGIPWETQDSVSLVCWASGSEKRIGALDCSHSYLEKIATLHLKGGFCAVPHAAVCGLHQHHLIERLLKKHQQGNLQSFGYVVLLCMNFLWNVRLQILSKSYVLAGKRLIKATLLHLASVLSMNALASVLSFGL